MILAAQNYIECLDSQAVADDGKGVLTDPHELLPTEGSRMFWILPTHSTMCARRLPSGRLSRKQHKQPYSDSGRLYYLWAY